MNDVQLDKKNLDNKENTKHKEVEGSSDLQNDVKHDQSVQPAQMQEAKDTGVYVKDVFKKAKPGRKACGIMLICLYGLFCSVGVVMNLMDVIKGFSKQ